MIKSRTQVGIVGAGPAGLMLGHLLHLAGIDSVILENRSQEHVVDRVRAGVLEQGTVDLMHEAGVGDRLRREGMRHEGIYIRFGGARHRIDMAGLTGGRAITIYGQNEVVKDLIGVRLGTARPSFFNASDVTVHDLDTRAPRVQFQHEATAYEVTCDVIAGCDGFHGVCRPSIPEGLLTIYERTYPFGWLGILAEAEPSSDELVYSLSDRGFALFSMRSPSVTRLYLQCEPDEDVDTWSDDRNLGRDAQENDDDGRLETERRSHPAERRDADAQLRRGADAARAPVPRRRRGAHRPADRRKGAEPRRRMFWFLRAR